MIFNGHISKANAQKMGYANAFDIKLVAGLVGEHDEKQYMVISLTINSNNSNMVIPIEYIDNIKYDAFDLEDANKIKEGAYNND